MIKELKIGKKVTKEEIEIWEKENNIFLPDDYKDFLANVGTGDVTDFYSDYDVIVYVKKIAEEEFYDEITCKITYIPIIAKKSL